ncbi:enoyl-CoA hydratase [Alkalihalophilus pseudofirmus]|uniref:crotonase/enoyl-CoA hydratase family protein n=1 Tax=Alkalihalobacterium alkalinitrilicum TaxID=427920 RepID=UPI00094C2174|nr:crotonase/enoyl-CoA hydratase family protein [Alkalihalobacterium alkalinitrilicum]OLO36368.1 enoyl-CoA hydratase [Alkalihalophilus pseudofirmus]
MNYEAIHFERRGSVALITLNRPNAMNAVNATLWNDVGHALESFSKDDSLQVAVLTGAGEKAFCAGADLKEIAAGRSIQPPGGEKWGFGGIVNHFVPKPVIAAVNGFALGGGTEIALACDLVVASEKASFGLPEVKRGLIAAAGGLLRLPRQIPLKIAMEAVLTGDPLSAEEALKWGLVNKVVPHEDVISTALALAEKISENAPLSLKASKEIVYRGLDRPLDHPPEAWEINDEHTSVIMNSQDVIEGSSAFAEKRKPIWKGC